MQTTAIPVNKREKKVLIIVLDDMTMKVKFNRKWYLTKFYTIIYNNDKGQNELNIPPK